MIIEENELIEKLPSSLENYISLIKQKISEIKLEKDKKSLLETESASRISQIESKIHQLSEENTFISKSSILNQCEILNCMNSLSENTFNIVKNYLSQNTSHLININNTLMKIIFKKLEPSTADIQVILIRTYIQIIKYFLIQFKISSLKTFQMKLLTK